MQESLCLLRADYTGGATQPFPYLHPVAEVISHKINRGLIETAGGLRDQESLVLFYIRVSASTWASATSLASA